MFIVYFFIIRKSNQNQIENQIIQTKIYENFEIRDAEGLRDIKRFFKKTCKILVFDFLLRF